MTILEALHLSRLNFCQIQCAYIFVASIVILHTNSSRVGAGSGWVESYVLFYRAVKGSFLSDCGQYVGYNAEGEMSD